MPRGCLLPSGSLLRDSQMRGDDVDDRGGDCNSDVDDDCKR